MRTAFLALCFVVPSSTSLAAAPTPHDTSVSCSQFTVDAEGITLVFTMSLEDFSTVVDLAGEKEGLLRPERYETFMPVLFRYLSARLTVATGGRELQPEYVRGIFSSKVPLLLSTARSPLGIRLFYRSPHPVKEISFRCDAFGDRVADPKHIVDFPDGQSFVLDKDRCSLTWKRGDSWVSQFGHFVILGIEHILTGWDHLVFLMSLLLTAQSFRHTIKFVTAFTVAHSITLGLTALRVIHIPGTLVEPLIAASIVYVAVENLLSRDVSSRWVLTFAFGLVHGLGFGGALVELNLPNPTYALLGFNIGVEFGQLGVIAILFPVLLILRRRQFFYQSVILKGGSVVAAGLGGFWFCMRVF